MPNTFEFKENKTVPNQKLVTIHRLPLSKKEGFLSINKESFEKALRKMGQRNYACFALYLWMIANADGYQFGLSPEAIKSQIGMPDSTVRDQIKKLIQFGFLVQKNEGSNQYDFYEDPEQQGEINFT